MKWFCFYQFCQKLDYKKISLTCFPAASRYTEGAKYEEVGATTTRLTIDLTCNGGADGGACLTATDRGG
jgi:hypothetical protein